eukprot:EG_transcript_16508
MCSYRGPGRSPIHGLRLKAVTVLSLAAVWVAATAMHWGVHSPAALHWVAVPHFHPPGTSGWPSERRPAAASHVPRLPLTPPRTTHEPYRSPLSLPPSPHSDGWRWDLRAGAAVLLAAAAGWAAYCTARGESAPAVGALRWRYVHCGCRRWDTCLKASRKGLGAPTGPKVELLIVGRSAGQEQWMVDACEEYEKRLRPYLGVATVWLKGDEQLLAEVAQRRGGVCVCLDENGSELASEAFAPWLYGLLEEGGSRCTFVIGGADGLPAALRPAPPGTPRPPGPALHHLALSRLTFTHLLARVVLLEQLYRAAQIRQGTKYHRA